MRLFYVLVLVFVQSCYSNAQTFEGNWQGELVIQGQRLPLVFDLVKENNSWGGFMQSPAQGNIKIPLSSLVISQDSIWIEVKSIGLKYTGVKLDKVINGMFSQGGVQVSLLLKREKQMSMKQTFARSQVILPPYSYDTTSVSIKNDFDNISLAGTLTFPKGKGTYPAVLLLTGSGPQNRDEELFGHQPFRVLADYLTRNGIVVLRVDDRGVDESEGVFETSTIENFSKDAISSFNFLRMQSKVDRNKVGIIGHSEGGLIAELLAGQNLPGLDFIVSLAGPAYSIDQLMVDQLYSVGKAAGMSENDLLKARIINTNNFAIVKGNHPTKVAYEQLLENMKLSGVALDNKQMERELLSMLSPAYRYFMRIEPEEYIKQITIPVFAAFGSLDVQVPAASNLMTLQVLLPKNSKTVLKEYQGMNHLFQKAKTGQISEYSQIEETLSPIVMQDIVNWIKGL